MQTYPIVQRIPPLDPERLLRHFPREGVLFLDSRYCDRTRGRYSFLGVSPFKILEYKAEQRSDPFAELEAQLVQFTLPLLEELPPFQGGAAGMFGFELAQALEKLPPRKQDDLQCPDYIIGFYDLVIAWDHQQNQAWIFSSGFPFQEEPYRQNHAKERLSWALEQIRQAPDCLPVKDFGIPLETICSTMTPEKYEQAVERVIKYIRAGDIFEANISQRFSTTLPPARDIVDLYHLLNRRSPAPFSAFLQYKKWSILSASMERFLKLHNKHVETRPIKGTRPRHSDPDQDQKFSQELLASEKDRAENIMIVDLMRNDLSRVCLPHTVKVPQLCALESYATVHHLVSVVQGELAPDKTRVDLLRATFPGGSVTGAPKIRAIEIIQEIEPTVRGPYCGSMGYIGFNGEMDLSITIRTFVVSDRHVTFQVGGAVTIDSVPREEYNETLAKAKALQQALTMG